MDLDKQLQDLEKIATKALKSENLSIALKAKEALIKLLLELKKVKPLDVRLMSDTELDQVLDSAEKAWKESK